MPVIPRINPQAAGGGAPYIRSSGVDIGRGLGAVGREISAELEQRRLRSDKISAAKQYAELARDTDRMMMDMQANVQPGAEGFTSSFMSAFQDRVNTAMENVPESQRELFEIDAIKLSSQYNQTADVFERTERDAKRLDDLGDLIDINANLVASQPGIYRAKIDEIKQAVSIAGLKPDDARDQVGRASNLIGYAAVQSIIDQNPSAAIQRLRDGEFDDILEGKAKVTLLNAAEREQRTRAATARAEARAARVEQRAILSSMMRDESAARLRGQRAHPGIENMVLASDLDDREKQAHLDTLELHSNIYAAQKETELTSLAEDLAVLQGISPEGEGFASEAQGYDVVKDVIQDKWTAIENDSAGYILAKDPILKEQMSAAQTPQDMQAVMDQVEEYQEAMGVPKHLRNKIPKAVADDLVLQFNDLTPGKQQAEWLRSINHLYQDDAPEVVKTLVGQGLPEDAAAGMWLSTEANRNRYFEDHAAFADNAKILSSETKKNIQEAILAESEGLISTFALTPGGSRTSRQMIQAMTTAAYGNAVRGANPEEAAVSAYQEFAASYSGFVDGVRVPMQYDTGMVGDNLDQAMRELENAKLQVPAGLGIGSNLDDDQVADQYVDLVQQQGRWVTNADGDGVVLYDADRNLVRWEDGTILEIKFDDMRSNARRSFLLPPTSGQLLGGERVEGGDITPTRWQQP